MIVIEEQLLLDLDYLGVKVEVGVGPGPVEVLTHQVTPAAQDLQSVVLSLILIPYQVLESVATSWKT